MVGLIDSDFALESLGRAIGMAAPFGPFAGEPKSRWSRPDFDRRIKRDIHGAKLVRHARPFRLAEVVVPVRLWPPSSIPSLGRDRTSIRAMSGQYCILLQKKGVFHS